MNKRTPVSVYRLFSRLSNKQILFDSFQRTPCTTGTFTTHFTSIRLESSITMEVAAERIREKFQVKHAKLFFSICIANEMVFLTTYDKEIGFLDFMWSYFKGVEKCRYFLAVSKIPLTIKIMN